MSMNRTMIAIAAPLLVLAACAADTTAPGATADAQLAAATQPVYRAVYQGAWTLDGVYWGFECEGQESELIAMTGEIRHRLQLLEDGAGGFHVTAHQLSHNVGGVGLDSGEQFRVQEMAHETFNDNGMGRLGSFTGRVTLTGRDSCRGFIYTLVGRFVINANDELVVEREAESFTCTI
jgi:hypothetical protein